MLPGAAVKIVVTPVLLGAATVAGRRWGHHVGGWLVALPLTSGPVAWFLTVDHGSGFAARAAVGMLAGTASQISFAMAYRRVAGRGWKPAIVAGSLAFAVSTLALAELHPSLPVAAAVVAAALAVGVAVIRRSSTALGSHAPVPVAPPRWELPMRMAAATVIVFAITTLAPVIGAQPAGLLSPFPVFGAVLAVFSQRSHGPCAAVAGLDGLVLGLAAPAAFFLVLGVTLTSTGLPAFAMATAAALLVQAATLTALPWSPALSAAAARGDVVRRTVWRSQR